MRRSGTSPFFMPTGVNLVSAHQPPLTFSSRSQAPAWERKLSGKLRFDASKLELQSWSFACNYIPKLELGNEKREREAGTQEREAGT
jgi:hypothetical protein